MEEQRCLTECSARNSRRARSPKPVFERQMIMKAMFVGHDRFEQTTKAISDFHMPVKGGLPDFGFLFVLAGDPRTGKTFAMKRYAAEFPDIVQDGGIERQVVYVDLPVTGRRRAFLNRLAEKLNTDRNSRMSDDDMEAAVLMALRVQKVQLLLLDEYQEALTKSDPRVARQYNGLVRKILNLLSLNVIVAGLVETYETIKSDAQLKGRGLLPHFIVMPYEWENNEERSIFRFLCDEFDDRLSFLEKSGLGSMRTAQRLYWVTDGIIGVVKDFVFSAVCKALNDGSPKILDRHFAETWDRIEPAGTTFNPFNDDIANAPSQTATAKPKAEPRRKKPQPLQSPFLG